MLDADGLEGLVLRYGFFYGPGTYYAADGSTAEDVRRRRLPVVGSGTGVFSFIHVDDAADATVAAVERGAPGVYNVVDDEPAAMSEWVPVFADGRRRKASRAGCRSGWRSWSPARTWRHFRSSCAARRTRRPSASSAGGPPTRAGAAGFAESLALQRETE